MLLCTDCKHCYVEKRGHYCEYPLKSPVDGSIVRHIRCDIRRAYECGKEGQFWEEDKPAL